MADLSIIGSQNLRHFPGNLFLEIRNRLNVNDHWTSYVGVLGENYIVDVEAVRNDGCPASKLFNELGSQLMTIKEFVDCAAMVGDYSIVSLFDVYIPVQITQEPLREMCVLEGESISLTVKAKGWPNPEFQWYKNNIFIEDATQETFHLYSSSQQDAGDYYCVVYNSPDTDLHRLSKPVRVQVLPAPQLEIKEHPRSCTIKRGSDAVFKCEAYGGCNLYYQWFLGKNRLQDQPNVIQGSNTNELHLYNVSSSDWIGCYTCLVHVQGQRTGIMTNGAILQITDLGFETRYTATDKVALLIGNYDYRSDHVLSAPKNDVQTLSHIFQSLNFKVVSLLNLTKTEIISAVHEFRKLVGAGVYCVFYFCGHGFEVANQCFLVPTDAPVLYNYKPCVSADLIFRSLLQKKPQICCMILDICRKSQEEQVKPGLLAQDIVERGNAIVCYGTSYGLAAYENKNFGILVSHLKNVLGKSDDIETVFKNLRQSFATHKVASEDSNNLHKQIPEIRTNLLDVNRSFADRIEYRGQTAIFTARRLLWEMAHRKPDPNILNFQFPDFVVRVRLDFQQEFSNVLKIYTSVMDPGPTKSCTAFVAAIPADVAEKARIVTISHSKDRKLCKNYVTIHNIHRLKSSMVINITVKCTGPDAEKTEPVDLGFPLISRLGLWKERQEL